MSGQNADWQKVEQQSNNIQWDFNTSPVIEGIYSSMKDGLGPNNSTLIEVKVRQPDGSLVTYGVWCNSVLKDKMSEVPLGYAVRISFLGERPNKQGNRKYRDFEVLYKPAAVNVITDIHGYGNPQMGQQPVYTQNPPVYQQPQPMQPAPQQPQPYQQPYQQPIQQQAPQVYQQPYQQPIPQPMQQQQYQQPIPQQVPQMQPPVPGAVPPPPPPPPPTAPFNGVAGAPAAGSDDDLPF